MSSSGSEVGLSKMAILYFSNEFPRENLQDIFRLLHNHSKDRRHPLLAHFINEATFAVKNEIQKLPTQVKQLIPPFATLLSWAEKTELREGLLCGAVDGVLLIVAQLATYIGYVFLPTQPLIAGFTDSIIATLRTIRTNSRISRART
jgi:monodictyphenone polyketide synthase